MTEARAREKGSRRWCFVDLLLLPENAISSPLVCISVRADKRGYDRMHFVRANGARAVRAPRVFYVRRIPTACIRTYVRTYAGRPRYTRSSLASLSRLAGALQRSRWLYRYGGSSVCAVSMGAPLRLRRRLSPLYFALSLPFAPLSFARPSRCFSWNLPLESVFPGERRSVVGSRCILTTAIFARGSQPTFIRS